MRLPSPMTTDEFEDALEAALRGEIIADSGAPTSLDNALGVIARNPDAPDRDELVASAREIFASL